MKVNNFTYNGFSGQLLSGHAPYTAEFVEWTNDPGVALFHCSDGKPRRIPTFALVGSPELPKQDMANAVMFGHPSSS